MRFALLLLILLTCQAQAAAVDTGDPQLDAAFDVLMGRDFSRKADAVADIAASGHPRAETLLRGILDGSLRVHKRSKRLVKVSGSGSRIHATDVFDDKDLGEMSKRKARKIPINNAVRTRIQGLLATFQLDADDAAARLAAVQQMLEKPAPAHALLLRERVERESDAEVRVAMQTAIALADLGASEADVRLQAVQGVSDSLEPVVRNALARLVEAEPDKGVAAAAAKALQRIDERIEFYELLETLFFGLSLGSVLVLAAIGLAITFGVMGVINMAHGELIMLGAYTTYLLQQLMPDSIGLSIALAVPAAFVVSGLTGIAIERGVIRFLYGRPLETLLATFGISLVLQQLVRTVVSPQNVAVSNPEFMSGYLAVNSVLSLTWNRLYIILFCILVFAGLFMILKRTRLGLEVRAVSQNRAMARAMGVRSSRVDALTFGLGSGIAGIAGVALSQLTNVGPNMGQAYIVDSFMVVVFGGVGNLWGTLVGGIGLGIANKFLEPWSGAVLAKILVLVFIILFIQKRPRGLFPQKGRAAEG